MEFSIENIPKKFVGQEKINIPQTAYARAEAMVGKLKWDNVVFLERLLVLPVDL